MNSALQIALATDSQLHRSTDVVMQLFVFAHSLSRVATLDEMPATRMAAIHSDSNDDEARTIARDAINALGTDIKISPITPSEHTKHDPHFVQDEQDRQQNNRGQTRPNK